MNFLMNFIVYSICVFESKNKSSVTTLCLLTYLNLCFARLIEMTVICIMELDLLLYNLVQLYFSKSRFSVPVCLKTVIYIIYKLLRFEYCFEERVAHSYSELACVRVFISMRVDYSKFQTRY